MSMFNPENQDIAFARDCVINTLTDINERPGAIFSVAEDQAYLSDIVRKNHERSRLLEAAKMLNRPGRRGRKRAANVVDLPLKARVSA